MPDRVVEVDTGPAAYHTDHHPGEVVPVVVGKKVVGSGAVSDLLG